MIKTTNLSYRYPAQSPITFPDFSLAEGQTLLVTGNSGCGKTTLLHLMAGLLTPATGSIAIGDAELQGLRKRDLDRFRGQNIGLVLQEAHFIPSLSVLENLEMASWLACKNKNRQKAINLLTRLDLAAQIHKNPLQLSVGQQQRVSIARALVNEPKLILADEPTSSLDDENATAVATLLGEMALDSGSGLIIVTHDQRLKSVFPNSLAL
jgi:ABC-type lipoprotein export system ATPase subunit